MIDLSEPLAFIDSLIPDSFDVVLDILPDLDDAFALADSIGADPGPLVDFHTAVDDVQRTITDVVQNAFPLMNSAAHDLFAIGEDFLSSAGAVLPRLLDPTPGSSHVALAELGSLAFVSTRRAEDRLAQLRYELDPAIHRLDSAGQEPLPPLPPPLGAAPQAAPPPAPIAPPPPPPPAPNTAGEAAVAAAKSQLGTPYVWGGTTPGVGFDCSGFTQWAWRQAGVELPRLAQEQNIGRAISREELQEGDLAVWNGHVAMYAGDGQLIEAGDPVGLNPLRENNLGMEFMGYYRPTG